MDVFTSASLAQVRPPDLPPDLLLPASVPVLPCPSRIVLRGLYNPRGLCLLPDGSLLLVEAGKGEANTPFSGRLLHFGRDDKGQFLPSAVKLSGLRSMNMQARMCRDEIFGLADVACGGGICCLSQTDYVSGSRVLEVSGQHGVSTAPAIIHSKGNLNALCYHPVRRSWLSVKPDTNQVVEWTCVPGQTVWQERVLASFAPLAGGQESVPVCLVCEPDGEALFITLFSGELRRDPTLTGIEFEHGAGQVVRLNPATGELTPVVSGLNMPTGLAFSDSGHLLVLELCDEFLHPMPPEGLPQAGWHGGFRRFSGRLLAIDLGAGKVQVLAQQLDTPSNLLVSASSVLISEGMGLPGRLIVGPEGALQPLEGFVRELHLPECLVKP